MADLANIEKNRQVVEGPSGVDMIVNTDGSINVSSAISTPPASTRVVQTAFGSVNTTAGTDTSYTITNTKILTIQRLTAAAEDEAGGTVVELFYDPNGDLSSLTRLDMIVINGSTYQTDLNTAFTGNGTRRIVMRRRGYTASGREVFSRWEGYES